MTNFLILKQTNGQNANVLEKEEIEDYYPNLILENVEILKILIDEDINFNKNNSKNPEFKEILDKYNADFNIETQIFTVYIDLTSNKDILKEINNFLEEIKELI